MDYLLVKQIHVTAVTITAGLFLSRWLWVLTDSPHLRRRWVRWVPHVNDTLLLASGVTLTLILHQYPVVHAWLTAKFLALLAYIALGSMALKRARTRAGKFRWGLGAIGVFVYLVSVAWTRSPWPWA